MFYILLLQVGVIGYAALMLLGTLRGGGHHQAHNSGHIGHGHGGSNGGSHGHTHTVGQVHSNSGTAHAISHQVGQSVVKGHPSLKGAAPTNTGKSRMGPHWLSFSPLDLFSLAMGAGLTGYLLKSVHEPLRGILAAVGALVFTLLLVKPLMNYLMQFAGKPSEGLEGQVARVATAETTFDSTGKGLVNVMLDGQISRMLAYLPQDEFGHPVRKGDELVILEVNPSKGTCVVTTQFQDGA